MTAIVPQQQEDDVEVGDESAGNNTTHDDTNITDAVCFIIYLFILKYSQANLSIRHRPMGPNEVLRWIGGRQMRLLQMEDLYPEALLHVQYQQQQT